MGLIRWFKREKIRRRARKEIRDARRRAPPTRQGQRALARKTEDIRTRMNTEIEKTCPRQLRWSRVFNSYYFW